MHPGFTLFSFQHFAAIIVIITVIALLIFWLQRKSDYFHHNRFNSMLGLVIVFNAVAWKFTEILSADFSVAEDLPLHICGITPYLLAAYLWKPRQQLFDILYYWILAGAGMALIIPDLQGGFPSIEYIRFFIAHGLPLFGMIYLVCLQDVRPSPGSYIRSFIALNLYAFFIAGPANLLTGGNYIYLRGAPPVDFGPIGLLPPWPWHIPLIEIFAIGLFLFTYSPFYLRARTGESPDLLTTDETPPN